MRPCVDIITAFSRYNMDMEVLYGLTCTFSAGIEEIDSLEAAVLNKMTGYFLYSGYKL